MGMHFMVALRKAMGEKPWLSVLRALYLEYGYARLFYQSDPIDDETVSIGRSWSTRRQALETGSETFSDGSTAGRSSIEFPQSLQTSSSAARCSSHLFPSTAPSSTVRTMIQFESLEQDE